MVEMTDYEINKRLAKIAGVNVGEWTNPVDGTRSLEATGRQPACALKFARSLSGSPWSPLTNWSQLGPLMERAAWEISYLKAREWDKREARWEVRCRPLHDESAVHEACDASQQKAICLAIIAAHESEQ